MPAATGHRPERDSSSSSRPPTRATSAVGSARAALTGPSGPALWRGVLGSALLTVSGFGAGALPVAIVSDAVAAACGHTLSRWGGA